MRTKTKTEQLQDICNAYIADGQPWPAGKKEIAVWAINKKLWTQPRKSMIEQCAQELADAMRSEMEVDPQGRTIHSKRFAKFREADENGKLVQKMLWFDTKSRTEKLMRISQKLWRNSILGECKQLRIEEESFNDNNPDGAVIHTPVDFEKDLLEGQHGTEYNPLPPPDDDDDDQDDA